VPAFVEFQSKPFQSLLAGYVDREARTRVALAPYRHDHSEKDASLMDTPVTPRRGHDGRYHYLYVTYDVDTFEWYGGKHSTENLEDGYRGSGAWVLGHPAPERLVTKWTDFFESEKESYEAEAKWLILELIDEDLLCRNIVEGGTGGTSETLPPRCPGWVETSSPCLSILRFPLGSVSQFG